MGGGAGNAAVNGGDITSQYQISESATASAQSGHRRCLVFSVVATGGRGPRCRLFRSLRLQTTIWPYHPLFGGVGAIVLLLFSCSGWLKHKSSHHVNVARTGCAPEQGCCLPENAEPS